MKENNGKILLETGTNELELLEFLIADNSFGINVAKITELMQAQPPLKMPNSNQYIEGVFQPRNEVYTIINLPKYLGLPESEKPEKDIYIVTNFNKMSAAFHVHGVVGISRISWEAIEKPDNIIYGGSDGVVTGIAKINNRIISILDFEKIAFDLDPAAGINIDEVQGQEAAGLEDRHILIAEDSNLLRRMIMESLRAAGFTQITVTTNGQEAWDYLRDNKSHMNPDRPWDELSCIITDIEMPKMDGHRLIKLIKSDSVLRKIPAIIFSSLIDEKMKAKGLEVGADAQLSKPEIGELVNTVTELINEYSNA